MKNLSVLFWLACLLNSLNAQNLHLNIVFEVEYSVGKLIPGLPPDKLKMLDNIIGIYSYAYCNNYSVYENTGSRKKDASISEGRMSTDNTIEYKDFNKRLKYRQSKQKPELVSREEIAFDQKWEIDHQRKDTILGYTCFKAVLNKGENSITTWFTPDIPISDGPLGYYGLPGMILQVELPMLTVKAVKIEEQELETEINMPKVDAYLTTEEFNKITRKN